eukprot:TRINITY_DN55481_c0_g1_i1.p1 TRINITY_DN55481_c0_g1~~TRINITY_DN55481_c0_g1_i1.p1  ORF type:complete len:434 (+),score=66.38 TRINITY_DN55481_c0_g1_i1:125-1426(+)
MVMMDAVDVSSSRIDFAAKCLQASAAALLSGGAHMRLALPLDVVPLLLELLDANSLANLRRSAKLGSFGRETHVAELRALVLDLLRKTKFPFTHAAYVLGLNGSYYSYDTVTEDHYGIPEALPSMICRLFRLAVPGVCFTTIRLQKLAATANFGGQHRTLAFSLATPAQESQEMQTDASPKGMSHMENVDEDLLGSIGYVLCLGDGCIGGRGEVCKAVQKDAWSLLTTPSQAVRWVPFPRSGWLQWHWPKYGDLYTITITCESALNQCRLTGRERRQMVATGFLMPEGVDETSYDEECSEVHACSVAACEHDTTLELPQPLSQTRHSTAARNAAKRILGMAECDRPSVHEVEAAFRQAVRQAHPDRQARDRAISDEVEDRPLASQTESWAISQLKWARRVLRDVGDAASGEIVDGSQVEVVALERDDLLMLGE